MAAQLLLDLQPPVPAGAAALQPRRRRQPTAPPLNRAVQLVIAFPAKPHQTAHLAVRRRHRPINPHAAANALALQHRDIATTVAANISRRTGHPKEDLEQIAMLGILQAARRYAPERGLFRPFARTYANGEVYHYLRDKGFLIKVPASWRELYARGQKLIRLGTAADDLPHGLGISVERWQEIVLACSQRVVAIDLTSEAPGFDAEPERQ